MWKLIQWINLSFTIVFLGVICNLISRKQKLHVRFVKQRVILSRSLKCHWIEHQSVSWPHWEWSVNSVWKLVHVYLTFSLFDVKTYEGDATTNSTKQLSSSQCPILILTLPSVETANQLDLFPATFICILICCLSKRFVNMQSPWPAVAPCLPLFC